jgi:hypothetical protein
MLGRARQALAPLAFVVRGSKQRAEASGRSAQVSGTPEIVRRSRTFRSPVHPRLPSRSERQCGRFSRLSSRPRYSRQRSPRNWNPISSRPRLLSSHAICPSPHHRRLKPGPVNYDLASDVTHAFARSESPEADPIINRFDGEARAIRGLGDVEIVARLCDVRSGNGGAQRAASR